MNVHLVKRTMVVKTHFMCVNMVLIVNVNVVNIKVVVLEINIDRAQT